MNAIKPSISVIVPALNEEKSLEPTVNNILSALNDSFSDYEIIIFDDASRDKTAEIADRLATEDGKIKAVHNEKTMGFGYNYRRGVELAKYDYVSMIPADNEISAGSIKDIYNAVGKADIIIPYTLNYKVRPLLRQCLSCIFTKALNFLFNLKLNYYNGPVIHKRNLITSVKLSTNSFAFQAEALVKLIKSGYSFVQVGMHLNERKYGKSKALRTKNILGALKTVIKLIRDTSHFS